MAASAGESLQGASGERGSMLEAMDSLVRSIAMLLHPAATCSKASAAAAAAARQLAETVTLVRPLLHVHIQKYVYYT